MKKRLITLVMASIMTLTLISCVEAKDGNEQAINDKQISESINDKNNKKSNKDIEANKISKDEVIEIHDKTINRLEGFYNKYNLPYRKNNVYNKEVEVSELSFNSALAEQNGLDLKNIEAAKYDLTEKFTVNSAIELKWQSDMILSETIVPEYCKAITNEEINFKDIDEIVKKYVATPENNSVSETFEVGNYNIKVTMTDVNYLRVFIKSNYEVS